MKVFLTGATGFVGRNMLKRLLADGHSVRALVRDPEKDKALALLKRHFFEYERYQSVRSKEMMEARVDAVFASLYKDPTFISLTSGADGRLPLPNAMGGGSN